MTTPTISRERLREYRSSVLLNIVLYICSAMLWNLVWQYFQMRFVNDLSGRRQFSYGKWLLFCVLTFGLYHFYHEYALGTAITRIQRQYGVPAEENLGALSLVAGLLSFGVIAQALQQHHMNELVDALVEKPVDLGGMAPA